LDQDRAPALEGTKNVMSGQGYQERWGFAAPRLTWAVQRLILLNVLVLAIQLACRPLEVYLYSRYGLGGIGSLGLLVEWLGFQPDMLLYRFAVWQLITYQFLHAGLMHLFMNMLWLFFFGAEVERALGTRQFYRFYLGCGALGVLATFVPYFLWNDAPVVTGASGAVMGVMVAFALLQPDRQFYLFPLPMPINARALVLIVVVMNVITALGDSQISVWTHFGGMAAGYAYMKLGPRFGQWRRGLRRHPSKPKPKTGDEKDKIAEMVDNIFDFDDKKRH